MNLGFKDQFEAYVAEGSKTHTMRAGERWKAGMRADLYMRPRQKGMRLLFRAIVTKVEKVDIYLSQKGKTEVLYIEIEGQVLSDDETESFLWRDGFRAEGRRTSTQQATLFWRKQLANGRAFYGQIIHWDFEKRFMEKPGKPRSARRQRKAV